MPDPNVGATSRRAVAGGHRRQARRQHFQGIVRSSRCWRRTRPRRRPVAARPSARLNTRSTRPSRRLPTTRRSTVTRVPVFDEAEYVWRQYAGDFVISTFEEAINRGASQKIDLLAGKAENLRNSMRTADQHRLLRQRHGLRRQGHRRLAAARARRPDARHARRHQRGDLHVLALASRCSAPRRTNAYDNLRAAMRNINIKCSTGQGVTPRRTSLRARTRWPATKACSSPTSASSARKTRRPTRASMTTPSCSRRPRSSGTSRAPTRACMRCASARTASAWRIRRATGSRRIPAVNPANQLIDVVKVETICQLVTFNPRHLGVITVIT